MITRFNLYFILAIISATFSCNIANIKNGKQLNISSKIKFKECKNVDDIEICVTMDTTNKIIKIGIKACNDSLLLQPDFDIGVVTDTNSINLLRLENGMFYSSMQSKVDLCYILPKQTKTFTYNYLDKGNIGITDLLLKKRPKGFYVICHYIRDFKSIPYRVIVGGREIENIHYEAYCETLRLIYYL